MPTMVYATADPDQQYPTVSRPHPPISPPIAQAWPDRVKPCESCWRHPRGEAMKERMTGAKLLYDPQGCKDYAARLVTMFDERLAKEAAR